MLYRILTLIIKELQALLRDKQSREVLIVPLFLQLTLFPFAATLEVKNNTLAIFNEDSGKESIELIHRLSKTQAFTELLALNDETDVRRTLDHQKTLIVIRFPPDFSSDVVSGRAAHIQALLDGRRSNSGQIALGYVQRILQDYSDERLGRHNGFSPSSLVVRNWYNPNLDQVRHIVPSLVAIITTISILVITALSVAREREHGTFDQLLVSPLTPGMIMVGKTVPAMIVAMAQATVILSAGVYVYHIPFEGSLLLLYGSMVFYVMAMSGFGLLISSICATQQQAFLGVFSFLMPAMLLSGFIAPVENMPLWLQYLDWFNPLRHFIVIVKGVFLKDIGAGVLITNMWPLLIIAVGALGAANWMFRRRLE